MNQRLDTLVLFYIKIRIARIVSTEAWRFDRKSVALEKTWATIWGMLSGCKLYWCC